MFLVRAYTRVFRSKIYERKKQVSVLSAIRIHRHKNVIKVVIRNPLGYLLFFFFFFSKRIEIFKVSNSQYSTRIVVHVHRRNDSPTIILIQYIIILVYTPSGRVLSCSMCLPVHFCRRDYILQRKIIIAERTRSAKIALLWSG